MKNLIKTTFIAAALAVASPAAYSQENNALLEALVRKGILTDYEAEDIRAGLAAEQKKTSANKLNISSSVSELKISGDARLRYQYDNRDLQANPVAGTQFSNDSQRSRWRFRLRLNADYKFNDAFFGGIGLETGQAADSGNQTFENGFSDYDIFISKVFLGWHVNDAITVVAGKQKNPFYSTDLVWDSDINPTGLTESIALHKLFGWETRETGGGLSKDGKAVAGSTERVWNKPRWTADLVLGQFIFDDNNEFLGPDNDEGDDAYLFVSQLVLGYAITDNTTITVAPGWMFYNAADTAGLSNENDFSGETRLDGSPVSGETRNLNILLFPGDVSFKLGSIPAKFYWDVAYNVEGEERSRDIYELYSPVSGYDSFDHRAEDSLAWLVGAKLGTNKKAGDWSMAADYRQTGIAAVDPNLNDSDFALGELNTRGVKASVAYNFTDFLIGGVSYMYAWNLRDDLQFGQAVSRAAIADANVVQVLQVDLSWKF